MTEFLINPTDVTIKESPELILKFNYMDNKYGGMTVNERLYVSGLLNEFDKAVKEKDVNKVVYILEEVELTKPNIDPILESHGLISKQQN